MTDAVLELAESLQRRAAELGFDWPDIGGVWDKLAEEISELQDAATEAEQLHEIGDIMFCVVNLARFLGLDPAQALREANARFSERFSYVEERINSCATGPRLEQMELWWKEAKQLHENDLARAVANTGKTT